MSPHIPFLCLSDMHSSHPNTAKAVTDIILVLYRNDNISSKSYTFLCHWQIEKCVKNDLKC